MLFPADVEKELGDDRARLCQEELEVIDVRVATRHDFERRNTFYRLDNDRFVIRTVEYTDHRERRCALVMSPEEVVGSLDLSRHLEGPNTDALRIHFCQNVANRAVFPRGVHTLEHDEQRIRTSSVEKFL